MPTLVPCTNCLRFHYGPCREAPRQCHQCGGFNHIERYCPHQKGVTITRGEPLPGTRRWCEMWGLDDDDELKRKVLNAIKTSPGRAIWVNNQCIYKPNEKHFNTEFVSRERGRSLESRITRKRSRSPARRYDDTPSWNDRRRSRSPLRQYQSWHEPRVSRRRSSGYERSCAPSPSPYRSEPAMYIKESPSQSSQTRSSSFASGSNAIVFDSRKENTRPAPTMAPVSFGMPSKPKQPRYLTGPSLSTFQPAQDRPALGNVTNVPRPHDKVSSFAPQVAMEVEQSSDLIEHPQLEDIIDDPEFVLGVTKGATEAE